MNRNSRKGKKSIGGDRLEARITDSDRRAAKGQKENENSEYSVTQYLNGIIAAGSPNNGQNPGNAENRRSRDCFMPAGTKMALILIIFGNVFLRVIAERFYDIIRSSFSIFAVSHAFDVIA